MLLNNLHNLAQCIFVRVVREDYLVAIEHDYYLER